MTERTRPRSTTFALLTIAAALASLLAVAPVAPAAAQRTTSWCSDGVPEPCVESASVDGVPVRAGDPTYDVTATPVTGTGSQSFLWSVVPAGGGFDLGAAARSQEWTVTFRTGSAEPRVAFTRGNPGVVARTLGPNTITISSSPVTVTGGCDQRLWPWTCPSTATTQWDALLGGEVTDYGTWSDVAQREAMFGYDVFTNIDATSVPAEIRADAMTGEQRLLIRMANSHFLTDGTSVVKGFMYQRIPNAFLRLTYGIDNPATLTGRGLDPSITGSGTGTVAVTAEVGALVVDAVDLSFSRRVLRLDRGVITPRRPQNIDAARTRVHRARIRFDEGAARGSRVVRHQIRCREIGGDHVVTKRSRNDARIFVRGLNADSAYWCRVRAISKAGPGRWSARDRVAARP